ncbi:jacalin-related lectin 3-like [Curcuma longa]|uniref:jacalin-related lectin 3-like n=1 Tax=Curcuma longa TaxID=136217 RepID=UPI003D9E833B
MASNIINNKLVLKVGPRGNLDLGPSFTTWDEAGYGKVKQILISYSADAINSIQMVYELNGKEVLADRHGGDGNFFESIRFGTGHYITSISGHFGSTSLNPSVVIKSLRFSTASWPSGSRTSSYGPFGSERGTPFRFESNGSDSLCGFHGSSSSTHLTSIGVNFLSGRVIFKSRTEPAVSIAWGNSFANWDESGHGRVKQILITYGEDAINSIQIVYEQNGDVKLTPRHGGGGVKFYSFGLGSNERFTSVRGHFGVIKTTNYTVIRSLCFDTNLGSFGPFGCQEGTPFSFEFSSSGSFYGFHGSSNSWNLTAIGVYIDISDLKRFQYPQEPRVVAPPPK